MGRKQNEFAHFMCHTLQKLKGLDLRREVEKCRWLIKKDNRCLLSKGLCNHHFLSFTVRKGLYHTVLKLLYAYSCNGFIHYLLIVRMQFTKESRVRGAS